LPVNVAVSVTGWPCGDGLGEPATVAVVVSGLTIIVTVGEVDPWWVVSPE
jgi:hypothetical protein